MLVEHCLHTLNPTLQTTFSDRLILVAARIAVRWMGGLQRPQAHKTSHPRLPVLSSPCLATKARAYGARNWPLQYELSWLVAANGMAQEEFKNRDFPFPRADLISSADDCGCASTYSGGAPTNPTNLFPVLPDCLAQIDWMLGK